MKQRTQPLKTFKVILGKHLCECNHSHNPQECELLAEEKQRKLYIELFTHSVFICRASLERRPQTFIQNAWVKSVLQVCQNRKYKEFLTQDILKPKPQPLSKERLNFMGERNKESFIPFHD